MALIQPRSLNHDRLTTHIISHALLLLGAAIMLLPLAWMVSTSLKQQSEVFLFPPRWIPKQFMWSNYAYVFTVMPFSHFMLNTSIITGLNILGNVSSCSLVAYAFARLKARGKNALFFLVLSTMMLPFHVTMIPQFVMFSRVGWVNTFLPLTVPAFFANAYQVFLLRQFFRNIPRELDDAAAIDGCGPFGIFWRIVLPLSGPIIVTIVLTSFLYHWNDFLGPLIYLNSQDKQTLALGLAQVLGYAAGGQGRWEILMAASTLTLLPCIVAFALGQRYFVQGIALTGLKG